MRNPALLMIILILSSCCKATFQAETFFNNTTNDKIELRVYSDGISTSSYIEAKATYVTPFWFPYGAGSPADSVQVFVKDIKQQTHYSRVINKPAVSANILPFAHYRNLLNMDNYQTMRKELACGSSYTKYTYNF